MGDSAFEKNMEKYPEQQKVLMGLIVITP